MNYNDIAKQLRGIARRADTFGHDRQRALDAAYGMKADFEAMLETL